MTDPHFSRSLTTLANALNATFMPVAAAKAEGEVHLQVDSPGSVGASLVRADGAGKTVAVRSVDLAAHGSEI